jgi:hypothetical protein
MCDWGGGPNEMANYLRPPEKLSDNHPARGKLTEEEFDESGYDGPMMLDDALAPKPENPRWDKL